ncbi:proline--tRNA ligase [Malassezia cuniculi]|uniref:proline--tRNA ligase n=1 Tax=Malassezia cuniculi TaxID=948313 RepID=A0AAF0ERD0_9BASI|nr:proline--tRNA ligase [Malassezia cuniculi]
MSAALQAALASLSIEAAPVTHTAAPTHPEWTAALDALSDTPAHRRIKTLVFKPKTPKSETPIPVVVVSDDATTASSGAIGAALKLKELRLAAPELITDSLQATKDDVSPLSVTSENASRVRVALDAAVAESSDLFAVRARSSSETVFIPGTAVAAYLASTGVQIDTLAFADLAAAAPAPAAGGAAKSQPAPKTKPALPGAENARIADAELIGITVRKELDFPEWYQQVLRKGDMLDYYDVSGCYILKPLSYFIWESIQEFFNEHIRSIGVQNCYFPMFVSSDVLEREKDHIEGFAPEVAWVTRAGKSDLEKPVAIRPTSETVMYPYYAKWIQSHRDLPLRLNQWNSVVRWEFKHPQPFLRTREFLWQEGHTAHLTQEAAHEEVMYILELYRRVYEELLAVPVVPGVKSEKEKFAGGLYTTTVEGFIPTTGRGIQGGTSHGLGQNFSRMFDISVQDPKAREEDRGKPEGRLFVWQNSWGISTRSIGVAVMVHGDDKGLVLPPRVAQTQVVFIPCGLGVKVAQDVKDKVNDACAEQARALRDAGVRAHADLRDNYSPGFKFNDWELRGTPLRIEVGPKDIASGSAPCIRRDTGERVSIAIDSLVADVPKLLEKIQREMFERADTEFREHRKVVTEWDDFTRTLNSKCHVIIPWCEEEACEDQIKERSARTVETEHDERAPSMGAKSLCIPFDQDAYPSIEGRSCPQCGKAAKRWTMFGRSY